LEEGVALRGLRDTGRAMSQENVELVAEYLQRGPRGVDAMAEFWDPDINWRAAEGAIDDAGELHGPEAVRRYAQDWFDMFDDLSVVAEELVHAGADRVVAVQLITGRAKMSGVETEIRFSVVYTLRDGKIVQGREYMDKEQALEAVGLRE
jgi:ketosteroid isomerase-like protein